MHTAPCLLEGDPLTPENTRDCGCATLKLQEDSVSRTYVVGVPLVVTSTTTAA